MKKKLIFLITLVSICAAAPAQSAGERSESKIVVGGIYYYVHTVKTGETLSSLGLAYGTDQETIRKNNPHVGTAVKAGQVIKIPIEQTSAPKQANRRTATHIINSGETAYSIAKRYGVSIDNLIEANPGFDPLHISIGQTINIPRQMLGSASDDQIREGFDRYKEALSDLSPDFEHHIVGEGETLYSIGRKYNMNVDVIRKINEEELKDGLKFGSIIRIPVEKKTSSPPDMFLPAFSDAKMEKSERGQVAGTNGQVATPKKIDTSKPLNVVMLLPFRINNQEQQSFTGFYYGSLLALKDLKKMGISANVDVVNSGRTAEEALKIIESGKLNNADLVIGPVYDESFTPVAEFAASNGIPVVSPLATVSADNPFVFQVSPDPAYKYKKLEEVLSGDYNIVLISPTEGLDSEFYNEITKMLHPNITKITYSKTGVLAAMVTDRENILLIPTEDESITDAILTQISTQLNSSNKSYKTYIVGGPRWTRFASIDKELFFKLGVMYITSYHADRSNGNILKFDSEYILNFGDLPTYYSYRGYDITKLFIHALKTYGQGYAQGVGRNMSDLLQVKYDFEREGTGKWINREWMLVKYRDDYIIDVK